MIFWLILLQNKSASSRRISINHQRQSIHLFIHFLSAALQQVPPSGDIPDTLSETPRRLLLIPDRLKVKGASVSFFGMRTIISHTKQEPTLLWVSLRSDLHSCLISPETCLCCWASAHSWRLLLFHSDTLQRKAGLTGSICGPPEDYDPSKRVFLCASFNHQLYSSAIFKKVSTDLAIFNSKCILIFPMRQNLFYSRSLDKQI